MSLKASSVATQMAHNSIPRSGALLSAWRQLAALYATRSRRGCIGYFRTVVDTPVVIVAVRRSGDSAVVQLRQRHPPRRWSSIVLRRRSGVWQATALRRGR
jgi:hypothetical protein